MNKRQLSIDEIRDIQIQILNVFDEFCKFNGLNYSLAGGSLLGSKRHLGYIPWDDDIDVMMPRQDYEFFMREFEHQTERLTLFSHLKKSKYIPYLFSKISMDKTHVFSDYSNDLGINIDVFPIDSLGKNLFIAKARFYAIVFVRGLIQIRQFKISRKSRISNFFFRIVQYFLSLFSLELFNRIIELLCSESKGRFSISIGSSYVMKEFVSSRLYESYESTEFEGKDYQSITNFDEYLSMIYGDYMKIPEKSNQINHNYKAFEIL